MQSVYIACQTEEFNAVLARWIEELDPVSECDILQNDVNDVGSVSHDVWCGCLEWASFYTDLSVEVLDFPNCSPKGDIPTAEYIVPKRISHSPQIPKLFITGGKFFLEPHIRER